MLLLYRETVIFGVGAASLVEIQKLSYEVGLRDVNGYFTHNMANKKSLIPHHNTKLFICAKTWSYI